MTTYKHPKLGRVAKQVNLEEFYITFNDGFVVDYPFSLERLLALGFEEVKEELTNEEVLLGVEKGNTYSSGSEIKQEDWIKKAFDYYYEGESPYAFEECAVADARIFREAIEKHMPHLRKKIPLGNMIKWYKDRNGFKEINLSPFQIIICALSDIDLLDDYNEEDLYRYRDDLLEE